MYIQISYCQSGQYNQINMIQAPIVLDRVFFFCFFFCVCVCFFFWYVLQFHLDLLVQY